MRRPATRRKRANGTASNGSASHGPESPTSTTSTTRQYLSADEIASVKAFLERSDTPFSVPTWPMSRKRKRGYSSAAPPMQATLSGGHLDVQYDVKPRVMWDSLRPYRQVTHNDSTIRKGDCILVKHDESVDNLRSEYIDTKSQWKAEVLDVRALDGEHIYLLVAWLYRPEDLATGRQAHHGEYELIHSNQLDVIDALATHGAIDVVHYDEADEESAKIDEEQYFWRQTFDWAGTKATSKLRRICVEDEPHNPDNLIIQCANSECRKWLHASCIVNEALRKHAPTPRETDSHQGSPPGGINVAKRTAAVATSMLPDGSKADFFISGEASWPKAPAAERTEIVITTQGGDQKTVPPQCLFCDAQIDP